MKRCDGGGLQSEEVVIVMIDLHEINTTATDILSA